MTLTVLDIQNYTIYRLFRRQQLGYFGFWVYGFFGKDVLLESYDIYQDLISAQSSTICF